jgi:tetratricopeptide (TPR) repeat protein
VTDEHSMRDAAPPEESAGGRGAGGLSLDELRTAFAEQRPRALEALRDALAVRRREPGDHAEWARLCEEAGESALALSEYQLALRDDPDDVGVLARLSVLYEERGDLDHAIECAERRVGLVPGDGEAVSWLLDLLVAGDRLDRAREVLAEAGRLGLPGDIRTALGARVSAAEREEGAEEEPAEPASVPSDADVVRFAHLFAGRENVYARQWTGPSGEGGYSPVREPFTVQVARNHLLGSITVGVYPLRLDNTVTFFAFDVDITKRALARARGSVSEARRLKALVAAETHVLHGELERLGVAAMIEDSGYKGRHLWVFLDRPEDASVVRSFGALFLRHHGARAHDVHVEFFPKQAAAEGGVGNLIKLPLGIHRRSGRRSRVLLPDGSAEPDPHGALRRHPRLGRDALHAAIAALKATPLPPGPPTPSEEAGEPGAPAARDLGAFPPPGASWTAADFDTNPEVSQILAHCPVLAALKTKVERHRRLTHEEQVVLKHSLGHSGPGVLAVNYLLDACADVPPAARLQTPLAGNPISCPKIRRRIPHVTGTVDCNCLFDFAPGQYPNPRLHLLRPRGAPAPGPPAPADAPPWAPAERVRVLRMLRVRRQEIETELAGVEAELISHVEREAATEIRLEDGVLRLVHEEGTIPALAWEPAAGPGAGGTPGAAGGLTAT